jgi:uncharacterized membrane protein
MSNVARRVEGLKRTVEEVRDQVADVGARASKMLPSKSGRGGRLRRLVSKYPLLVGVGVIVLGFVAGFTLPSTKFENRRLGKLSDRTKAQLQQRAQELLEHEKGVIQHALTTS